MRAALAAEKQSQEYICAAANFLFTCHKAQLSTPFMPDLQVKKVRHDSLRSFPPFAPQQPVSICSCSHEPQDPTTSPQDATSNFFLFYYVPATPEKLVHTIKSQLPATSQVLQRLDSADSTFKHPFPWKDRNVEGASE